MMYFYETIKNVISLLILFINKSDYFICFDEVTLSCISALHPDTPSSEPMGCETDVNKWCIKGIVRKLYGKGRG
jgi:hypothetical protein